MKVKKVTEAVIRAEMLLDSYYQEKDKDINKVAVALAYLRYFRSELKREYGWQWTLTAPNLPKTVAEEITRFGAAQHKRWTWRNPPVKVTRSELAGVMDQ